jgi:uracil-DNA glycosylase family 4
MEGFFSKTETEAPAIKRATGCGACGLYRQCKTPRFEVCGDGRKKILVIAEQPGATEDERGQQLVGESGQFLRRKLRGLGIDIDKDCRKINAVACHPEKGRTPTDLEIECCRPRVWKEIEEFKPKLIVLMGGAAVQSFLKHRLKEVGGINKWRGWTIPDRDVHAWVAPMFHPAHVLHAEKNPAVETVFNLDLTAALALLDTPFPIILKEESCVEVIHNDTKLCEILRNALEWRYPFTIDIECTGLKPHKPGHQIITCAIASDRDRAHAFNFPVPGSKPFRMLRRVLMDPLIGKLAHNMKFEDNWLNFFMGSPVEGWVWDSMIAAHLLDNREDITGLKFQAYVNFGCLDYSSHIEQYWQSSDGDTSNNSINRIMEAPRNELLLYNGIDALVEMRLAEKQIEQMGMEILCPF